MILREYEVKIRRNEVKTTNLLGYSLNSIFVDDGIVLGFSLYYEFINLVLFVKH